jgi:hypothetical protein
MTATVRAMRKVIVVRIILGAIGGTFAHPGARGDPSVEAANIHSLEPTNGGFTRERGL